MIKGYRYGAMVLAAAGLAAAPAAQAQYQNEVPHNPASCSSGGPKIRVNVSGIKAARGTIRVQAYYGTKADWLEKGKWLTRVEAPARAGTMTFCLPVPQAGTYGVAVRHDLNGNGKTDLREDGGAMSNNPSINIFNLGKPSYKKTAFTVGSGVTTISIAMKYM
ncbi:DUF2141 domain-containing protein [Altererythrobacter sp. H2]|uniref:DUF2141 domain-containing protein n=1 Tax=Altererythrobacter sp. H2 TaxID=3108391 RepID=UPI002B4BE19D|nr:DUF2141 domain-containing protein [Altererythrobacter sp. H2]WRK96086.1 DUF2141 domain-containing protein [Altererythrobacter sp. H2]